MSERAQALEAALLNLMDAVVAEGEDPSTTTAIRLGEALKASRDALDMSSEAPAAGVSPQSDKLLFWKHLADEVNEAHQALDALGAPKTMRVRRFRGEGDEDITIGLRERIQALKSPTSLSPVEPNTMICPACLGSGGTCALCDGAGEVQDLPARHLATVDPTPPVKVDVSRDWCLHAAQNEPDVDIAVGVEPTPEPPTDQLRETPMGHRIFRHICGTPEDDGECMACSQIDCPDGEPLHYHHDGCPCCSQKPTVEPEPCVWLADHDGVWQAECRGLRHHAARADSWTA